MWCRSLPLPVILLLIRSSTHARRPPKKKARRLIPQVRPHLCNLLLRLPYPAFYFALSCDVDPICGAVLSHERPRPIFMRVLHYFPWYPLVSLRRNLVISVADVSGADVHAVCLVHVIGWCHLCLYRLCFCSSVPAPW